MPPPGPTTDQASAMPDTKMFGIPRYQPFMGGRSFDYEQKYPLDSSGEEASPEARVWLTYLEEAEMYDHDMIQGFRDTIDSLLVLAGLFSAIVATFVAQTSQSLKPDFAQLSLIVQVEQTALLRAGGNASLMNAVPLSYISTDSPTYTTADLWINGLFFTSLSLSVTTALLAVLIKQWCQAYTSVTSGSARDKVLIRQFRFDGLVKWKLPEIVGSLPLLLHLAFAVFFAGLSFFVYDLHKTLSSVVIICAILAEFLYFGSIIFPAIWLECPYRIPLLFRPARSLIYFLGRLRSLFEFKGSLLFPILHRYLPPGEPKIEDILVSLKEAEMVLLNIPHSDTSDVLSQPMLIIARSFAWLFTLSNNIATRRIVTAALYGCFIEYWHFDLSSPAWRLWMIDENSPLCSFMQAFPLTSMAGVALENAINQVSHRASTDEPTRSSLRTWVGFLDIAFWCSEKCSRALPILLTQDELSKALMRLLHKPPEHGDLRNSILRWGANLQYRGAWGRSFLHAAISSKSLDHVRWVIDRHCPVNEPVVRFYGSPLMSACHGGFVGAVKLLIENGADVNKIATRNFFARGACSPLTMSVAGEWSLEIGELLLNAGARLNAEIPLEEGNGTALQFAAQVGNLGAVCLFLERGAILTPKIKDTLHRLDWIGGSNRRSSDSENTKIEGILREYASRTIKRRCLPTTQLGPVLTRLFLA
ncbi:hypothetical protein DL96DRAFT_1504458 [Flagelloscypha sp. PMI_526]|nr:hypothetical protein DL96DRAFT_1504458 [Flagelloscypha sp. PMI_526]